MIRFLFYVLLLSAFSCKSLQNNDSKIIYHYLGSINDEVVGDFLQLELFQGDKIRIMPAYLRTFGSLSNSLIVRIGLNKKYGFSNYGTVISKTFGPLEPTTREWLKNSSRDDLLYHKSLDYIELPKRKEKVLRDTIIVQIGEKQFLFSPKDKP